MSLSIQKGVAAAGNLILILQKGVGMVPKQKNKPKTQKYSI
jgi:hypothetical protein